jgi:hypothetical protein
VKNKGKSKKVKGKSLSTKPNNFFTFSLFHFSTLISVKALRNYKNRDAFFFGKALIYRLSKLSKLQKKW